MSKVNGNGGNGNPFIGKQSYGIEKKELKALHKELKANKDIKVTKEELSEIDKAIETGNLGEYLENVGDAMKNALGLSLSTKIGKTDATKDIEEAKRLATEAELDCDLNKVLKHLSLAQSTYTRFEENTVKGILENSIINKVLLGDHLSFDENFKKFLDVLDELSWT